MVPIDQRPARGRPGVEITEDPARRHKILEQPKQSLSKTHKEQEVQKANNMPVVRFTGRAEGARAGEQRDAHSRPKPDTKCQ